MNRRDKAGDGRTREGVDKTRVVDIWSEDTRIGVAVGAWKANKLT